MGKLPQISGFQLVKVLKRDGWTAVKQEGSHLKLVKNLAPIGKSTVIVPQHKVIKKGTLSRILKDSRLSPEKLKKLL